MQCDQKQIPPLHRAVVQNVPLLYARSSRSWRALRLWFKLRSGRIDWDELLESHGSLAGELANIGDGLVLPGDPDWENPAPGTEDWQVVKNRTTRG